MKFKSYLPSVEIKHLVAYYWTLKASKDEGKDANYRFVPDGYVDWVFHLGTPWQIKFPGNNETTDNQVHLFGQIKKFVDLDISKGDLNLFGVKFYPWVARQLWKVDMHYLTDSSTTLEDLDIEGVSALSEQILLCESVKDQIKLMNLYISRLAHNIKKETLAPVLHNCINSAPKANLTKLNVCKRRIEQRFKYEIGISPGLFDKTLRINRFIESLKTKSKNTTLTQLALDYGFYDQSHCLKDFKQFTGYSPRQFLKQIQPDGDILNLRATP